MLSAQKAYQSSSPIIYNDIPHKLGKCNYRHVTVYQTNSETHLSFECCCLRLRKKGLSLHRIDALLLQCHPQNVLFSKHVCSFSCHSCNMVD